MSALAAKITNEPHFSCYQSAEELVTAVIVFCPVYVPASVIVAGILIAQSVLFDCGELVAVVFGTFNATATGEVDPVMV